MKYPKLNQAHLCGAIGTILGMATMTARAAGNAPQLPPLHPTKDVTATYVRSDGKHVVIRTSKGGYPYRVDYPDQTPDGFFDRGASYYVAISPTGPFLPLGGITPAEGLKNGFFVWTGNRQFDYLNHAAEDWIGQMKLIHYNGADMIAGLFCHDWTIKNLVTMTLHGHEMTADQDRVCLTTDGVILRYLNGSEMTKPGSHGGGDYYFSNNNGRYPSSMTAISVEYAPLPAATFAIPQGYQQPPPSPPPPSPPMRPAD